MDDTKLSDVMREYGKAIRGSWADLDGRCVRDDIDALADMVDEGRLSLSGEEAASLRALLGICPAGNGHWTEFCDDGCGEGSS